MASVYGDPPLLYAPHHGRDAQQIYPHLTLVS